MIPFLFFLSLVLFDVIIEIYGVNKLHTLETINKQLSDINECVINVNNISQELTDSMRAFNNNFKSSSENETQINLCKIFVDSSHRCVFNKNNVNVQQANILIKKTDFPLLETCDIFGIPKKFK